MYSKDDYKILELRNATSLCLDDLVALVINSALANDIRELSGKVMGMTPGFTFDHRRAKNLRELTIKNYKRYKDKEITDVDLMNYKREADAILRGDEAQIGGKKMKFFADLGKDSLTKQREAVANLERNYRKVSAEIDRCKEKMKRCVAESKGHAPESAIYRDNELTWKIENKRLTMLNKDANDLSRTLEEAKSMLLLLERDEEVKTRNRQMNAAFGDPNKISKVKARYEEEELRRKATLEVYGSVSNSVFSDMAETEEVQTDSEFGAQVAAEERRQTILDFAGVVEEETEVQETAANDAFAAQVNGKDVE